MLDEFALSLYVRDVYWAAQGRRSVDAVLIALMLGGLLVLGSWPLDLETAQDGSRLGVAATLALNVALAAVTLLKGKLIAGAVGVLVPGVALVGAVRLAKPTSRWARARYATRPARRERAERRFGPLYAAGMNRLKDLLGGAPSG